jgi:hypothetical protein
MRNQRGTKVGMTTNPSVHDEAWEQYYAARLVEQLGG